MNKKMIAFVFIFSLLVLTACEPFDSIVSAFNTGTGFGGPAATEVVVPATEEEEVALSIPEIPAAVETVEVIRTVEVTKYITLTAATATPTPAANLVLPYADEVTRVNGMLPLRKFLREAVRTPGDVYSFRLDFDITGNVTILRAVADDDFASFLYVDADGKQWDVLPLLKMMKVTSTEPANPLLRKYLQSRGVNVVSGEILGQNTNAVFLGQVKPGAYLLITVKDDPALQVNRGVNLDLVSDTDAFTVDLEGKTVANPTFVLP